MSCMEKFKPVIWQQLLQQCGVFKRSALRFLRYVSWQNYRSSSGHHITMSRALRLICLFAIAQCTVVSTTDNSYTSATVS
jgi:hypothetical protein